jgi:hypothetical protein
LGQQADGHGPAPPQGIFVTCPDRISVAGQLDVVCFDKTGTLTEQGLELLGARRRSAPARPTPAVLHLQQLERAQLAASSSTLHCFRAGVVPLVGRAFGAMQRQLSQLPECISELLATCHGLAVMGEQLVGDPLDQKLFAATGWELHDEHAAQQQGGGSEGGEEHASSARVCPAGQPGRAFRIKRRWALRPGASARARIAAACFQRVACQPDPTHRPQLQVRVHLVADAQHGGGVKGRQQRPSLRQGLAGGAAHFGAARVHPA